MKNPVPLIRYFIPITKSYSDDEAGLWDMLPLRDHGERKDWSPIEKDYRTVILADAGAGKTYELMAEAARLMERGRAGFFIPIEDIDEQFGEPRPRERLQRDRSVLCQRQRSGPAGGHQAAGSQCRANIGSGRIAGNSDLHTFANSPEPSAN